MMKLRRHLAVLLVVAAVAGCTANAQLTEYKTLAATQVVVDTAMKVYAANVVAGKVSAATQATVRGLFGDYQIAAAVAQAAYDAWVTAGSNVATFPAAAIETANSKGAALQTASTQP